MNQNKLENYDSYRTTPRTWRSNINSRNLSLPMKKALREALKNENKINCTKNVFNALVARNLCSQNYILTNEGQVVALEESSLLQQTKSLFLTINILELKLAPKERAETAVLSHLLSNKHIKAGCYAEGGDIKILLSRMCFDVICNAWRTHSLFDTSPI